MANSTYKSIILASRPKGLIVPGETFAVKTNEMLSEKDLKDDEVLVETLYLSLDPAMRGWLNGILYLSLNTRMANVHRCKILPPTRANWGGHAGSFHW